MATKNQTQRGGKVPRSPHKADQAGSIPAAATKDESAPGQKPLKPSREAFLRYHLLEGMTLAKAFVRAGYADGTGAKQNAWNLLQQPAMQARAKVLMREQLERSQITADRVMMELGRRAFSDVRELFDADGKFVGVCALSPDSAAAIDGIEFDVDKDGKPINVKVHRKGKDHALGILARHFKIAGHEIDDAVGKMATFADRLMQARERELALRK
jgi:phage terminase small subunit